MARIICFRCISPGPYLSEHFRIPDLIDLGWRKVNRLWRCPACVSLGATGAGPGGQILKDSEARKLTR